jgi:hypothetical protein
MAALAGQPDAPAEHQPPAPTNLTVTPLDGSVVLDWDRAGPDVEFYRIYRSTTPGERGRQVDRLKPLSRFKERGLHGPPADGGLTNGTTYYYSVQSEAYDGTPGGFSEQVAATPRRNPDVPVPGIKGTYWQIAPNSPEDYEWDNGERDNACDFSIWQAADGTWQLVSCIRATTHPGRTRLFYRWEAESITDRMWTPKGVFATSKTDPPYNEVEGRMQAPQVFRYRGDYFMVYNSRGAHLMRSADGKHFERIPDDDGNYTIFNCGRDIGMLDNREVDGRWYAYWVDNKPGMHLTRSADDNLLGEWEDMGHLYHPGFFESPFVQPYGDLYYLFVPKYVVVSDDPTDFDRPLLTVLEDENGISKAAAEIIHDTQHDRWYIAGYGRGIYVAELEWRPAEQKRQ